MPYNKTNGNLNKSFTKPVSFTPRGHANLDPDMRLRNGRINSLERVIENLQNLTIKKDEEIELVSRVKWQV